MTLNQLLERSALRRPLSRAVTDGGRKLTYGELLTLASTVGGGFRKLGVRHGDRVLIAVKNRLEHVVCHWALQRIGAVPTPVNFRLSLEEVRYVLQDSAAPVAIFEQATQAAVLGAAQGGNAKLVCLGPDAPAGVISFEELTTADACDPAPVKEQDIALILYTSGTTGRPKGVPRTHRNQSAGALAHTIQCGYSWDECTLGVMPLYHTMGVHSLVSMTAVNGCFACQPDWSAAGALKLIASEKVSALYLIPTLFYDLVQAARAAGTDLRVVQKLAYAGAPMLAQLTEACTQVFEPRVFVNHYGSTEIYTFSVRSNVSEKPGCAGFPGIHSALRVVEASTDRRVSPDETVAAGEKGEVIASLESDEAFTGYWNRPDADAKALRDGWYFTGDMGYLDQDGDLYVSGRVDDMIISGGENIHPVEVEEVVARHPQVQEVAVIGEPDEKWGERVVAFVVLRQPGLTAEELDQYCIQSPDLANFKRPRRVVFVSEIPKTASGKILRRLLRDGQHRQG